MSTQSLVAKIPAACIVLMAGLVPRTWKSYVRDESVPSADLLELKIDKCIDEHFAAYLTIHNI